MNGGEIIRICNVGPHYEILHTYIFVIWNTLKTHPVVMQRQFNNIRQPCVNWYMNVYMLFISISLCTVFFIFPQKTFSIILA